MASGVIAMYYIQETVYKYGDELAKPRPEHEKVAQLTLQEAAHNAMYMKVTAWARLSLKMRISVLLTTCMMLACLFIFMFMQEACFRPFETNNSIGAKEEYNGLDGNPLNILRMPGRAAHVLFFLACVCHTAYLKVMSRRTARLVEEEQACEASETEVGLADIQNESL